MSRKNVNDEHMAIPFLTSTLFGSNPQIGHSPNYSEEKCVVSVKELSDDYPTSYVAAIIKVPGEFTDISDMREKVRECPKTYTQFGGSAYFLMDEDHSDKFVFFSIGQYSILAGTGDGITSTIPWRMRSVP